MNINLPNNDFDPKAIMLSDICISDDYKDNVIYRACSDFTDYPDYPIYRGDYIVPAFSGVMVIGHDSIVVIDSSSLSQENWNVPVERVNCSLSISII